MVSIMLAQAWIACFYEDQGEQDDIRLWHSSDQPNIGTWIEMPPTLSGPAVDRFLGLRRKQQSMTAS